MRPLQMKKNRIDYRILSLQTEQLGSGCEAIRGGDPGKHSVSVIYCFIDNKLYVLTVPDRHDLTGVMTG